MSEPGRDATLLGLAAAARAKKPKRPALVAGGLGVNARAGSGEFISPRIYRGDGALAATEHLGVFRKKAWALPTSSIKALILRIQAAINGIDLSKGMDKEQAEQNTLAMEALVRRQSILQGVLVARKQLTHQDSGDFSKFLEQAKPARKSF